MTVTVNRKSLCPLCDGELDSLWGNRLPEHKDYHDWCPTCKHGWYVMDLMRVTSELLAFHTSKGKHGKSPEQIRAVILARDARRTNAD